MVLDGQKFGLSYHSIYKDAPVKQLLSGCRVQIIHLTGSGLSLSESDVAECMLKRLNATSEFLLSLSN